MRAFKTIIIFLSLLLSLSVSAKTLEWTFMVYMAADNNLHFDALDDLQQMAQVGSSDQVKIIALLDTLDPETSTKIYEIGRGNIKTIKDYGRNIDSGDWHELVDFFKFSSEQYPAKKLSFTIWNHGSGWDKKKIAADDKSIAYDDHSGNKITTLQLGNALKLMSLHRGSPVDLVATDACLMQTIEVAYEISPYANYFAASQEVEPYTGWPYQVIFGELTQKPEMPAQELGKVIADSYVNGTDAPSWSKTFSVVKLDSLNRLADTLSSLKTYLLSEIPRQNLIEIIKKSQTFSDAETVDIKNFVALLKQSSSEPRLQNLLKEVEEASNVAIAHNAHKGNSVVNANGLSLWTPPWSIDAAKLDRYSELSFDQKTQWSELIRFLYP